MNPTPGPYMTAKEPLPLEQGPEESAAPRCDQDSIILRFVTILICWLLDTQLTLFFVVYSNLGEKIISLGTDADPCSIKEWHRDQELSVNLSSTIHVRLVMPFCF